MHNDKKYADQKENKPGMTGPCKPCGSGPCKPCEGKKPDTGKPETKEHGHGKCSCCK